MGMRAYHVYVLTNHAKMLYVGVTSDLARRLYQHRHGLLPGFTKTYRLRKLVYFETTRDAGAAMAREKEIKGWGRKKKLALVLAANPGWEDLGERFGLVE